MTMAAERANPSAVQPADSAPGLKNGDWIMAERIKTQVRFIGDAPIIPDEAGGPWRTFVVQFEKPMLMKTIVKVLQDKTLDVGGVKILRGINDLVL
jgi:hypothetical protein